MAKKEVEVEPEKVIDSVRITQIYTRLGQILAQYGNKESNVPAVPHEYWALKNELNKLTARP